MLARWNPWQDLFDIQREMSEMMRRPLFPFAGARGANRMGWAPAVDVYSQEGDLVVRAELPGIDPEKDVEITVRDGVLSIRGERKQETKSDRENYYREETSYGAFARHIPLPEGVKPEAVKATYENGILEVVIPSAAELSAPKKIPVTSSGGRRALDTKGTKK